ncbi:MAG: hypothetical protein VKJ64_06010, partial [Leptolyngbyaceae bacterium]|nr:hypothetical protein [Leptolyngbyaceae bacterium]
MALAVGAWLQDGRYQIQEVLKTTDVDVTYQAIHTYLARSVVVKQLRSDVDWLGGQPLPNSALMTRLNRLAQCRPTCLEEVLDCFEEGDRIYLVLPVNPNPTLDQWLSTHGPVPPKTVLDILKPLVHTIERLHRQGLVHGELVPECLPYGPSTQRLVLGDISWRLVLTGLLANRHHTTYPLTDTLGLARIAYALLTGQTLNSGVAMGHGHGSDRPHQTIPTPASPDVAALIESVRATALTPIQSLTLTPTEWFISLQMAILAPSPDPVLTVPEGHDPVPPTVSDPSQSVKRQAEATPAIEGNDGNTLVVAPAQQSSGSSQLQEAAIISEAEQPLVAPEAPTETNPGQTPTGPDQTSQRPAGFRRQWWPRLLGVTSVVALVSGGVFGYAFRIQDADQLQKSPIFGNELFGSDQEFPPSDHWPGIEGDEVDASDVVLFEQPVRQGQSRPVVQVTGSGAPNNGGGFQQQPSQGWGQRADDVEVIPDVSPEVEAGEAQETADSPLKVPNNAENNGRQRPNNNGDIVTPVAPPQVSDDPQPNPPAPQTPDKQGARPRVEPLGSGSAR